MSNHSFERRAIRAFICSSSYNTIQPLAYLCKYTNCESAHVLGHIVGVFEIRVTVLDSRFSLLGVVVFFTLHIYIYVVLVSYYRDALQNVRGVVPLPVSSPIVSCAQMSTALALSASADWQDTESTASQLIQMAFLAREAEAAMPMPEGQQWQGQGQGQELAQGQEQLAQELPLQQSHKNECKSSKPNKHTKKHKHKHAHKPYGSKPSTAKLQQSVAAEQHELRHRQYIVTRICGEKKDAQGRSLFQYVHACSVYIRFLIFHNGPPRIR